MANATVSRLGQVNGSGDALALFLKVFSGEVLAAFEESNVFLNRHMVRSIASGKSAQFPALGKTTASYHTPGTEIVGTAINHAERVVSIDDLLISHAFISNLDEAMNHYEVRGEYSRQLGSALARTFDRNVARVGVLTARASATVSGLSGGSTINDADANTNADSLIESIFTAAQTLAEKDVPLDGEVYAFVRPAQYYRLVNSSSKLIDADFTEGRNGGIDSGRVMRVAGIQVVMTNNLPSANDTGNTNIPSTYRANYSTTVALVMHRAAVGTVKLIDMGLESEYDIRRQGTLFVAKMAVGHGILRPEAAVEIRTADPA